MATYVPTQLKATTALTASAADLVKPAASHTSIVRTFVVQANTAARTVTLNMATSTADAAATRFVDAYALTANVPWINNCWLVADTTTWLVGLASAAGSTVMFSAWGYDYS
jgi:hypothetical protein